MENRVPFYDVESYDRRVVNIGSVAPWSPWDPYPFTFLATIASVEAPFFSLPMGRLSGPRVR